MQLLVKPNPETLENQLSQFTWCNDLLTKNHEGLLIIKCEVFRRRAECMHGLAGGGGVGANRRK